MTTTYHLRISGGVLSVGPSWLSVDLTTESTSGALPLFPSEELLRRQILLALPASSVRVHSTFQFAAAVGNTDTTGTNPRSAL